MWLEIIMQVVMSLLNNCQDQANRSNVERLLKNPSRRERRHLRFAMRREADRQLESYLEGGPDDTLSDDERQYMCEQIIDRMGITE